MARTLTTAFALFVLISMCYGCAANTLPLNMEQPITAQTVIAAHERHLVCPPGKTRWKGGHPPAIRGKLFFYGNANGRWDGDYFNNELKKFGVEEYIADTLEDARSIIFIADERFDYQSKPYYSSTLGPFTVSEESALIFFCVVRLDVGDYFRTYLSIPNCRGPFKRQGYSQRASSGVCLPYPRTWRHFEEEVGIEME